MESRRPRALLLPYRTGPKPKIYIEQGLKSCFAFCSVLDNTKEYICRAVVTLVDHLGNVSSNLEFKLTSDNSVSETELRLNSLNQVSTLLLITIVAYILLPMLYWCYIAF